MNSQLFTSLILSSGRPVAKSRVSTSGFHRCLAFTVGKSNNKVASWSLHGRTASAVKGCQYQIHPQQKDFNTNHLAILRLCLLCHSFMKGTLSYHKRPFSLCQTRHAGRKIQTEGAAQAISHSNQLQPDPRRLARFSTCPLVGKAHRRAGPEKKEYREGLVALEGLSLFLQDPVRVMRWKVQQWPHPNDTPEHAGKLKLVLLLWADSGPNFCEHGEVTPSRVQAPGESIP